MCALHPIWMVKVHWGRHGLVELGGRSWVIWSCPMKMQTGVLRLLAWPGASVVPDVLVTHAGIFNVSRME